MVTLTAGHTLTSPMTCSPTALVDGYSFRNASGEAFGTIHCNKLLRCLATPRSSTWRRHCLPAR
jgi:hypothetical protein